jgi:glutamine amidotransferase
VITIVDVGIGNLRSVEKALQHVGLETRRTRDAGLVRGAGHVVVPGVGAFGDFVAALRADGLDAAIRDRHAAGRPTLGVCVGMQALLDESEEFGTHAGLGLVPGRVARFADDLVVPHSGWSRLAARTDDPLLGPADGAWFYFVHSYRAAGVADGPTVATADYGGTFPAAVRAGATWGVQFHPEKSQTAGLALLSRFGALPCA